MSEKKQTLLSLLIIVIIVSVIAGFLGGILSRDYLPGSKDLFTSETFIEKPQKSRSKTVYTSYLKNKDLAQAIIGIYPAKKEAAEELSLATSYNYSEAIAQGLILTSDGWVVTSFDNFLPGLRYVAITQEGRIFPIESFIEDPLTKINYFRIKEDVDGVDVHDFNVFKLAKSNEYTLGDEVYLLNRLGQVVYRRIKDTNWDKANIDTDIVKDTEVNSKFLLLSDLVASDFFGSPVINNEGEMMGIVVNNVKLKKELIVPISYIDSAITTLLKAKEIQRPSLGLYYFDLSQNFNLGIEVDANKGALIWGDQKNPFKPLSAAKEAGIEKQDIILKVENEEVNGKQDLTSLIQYYYPGDKVKLSILRDGVVREISVQLGEVE